MSEPIIIPVGFAPAPKRELDPKETIIESVAICAYCRDYIMSAEDVATSQNPPHVELCNSCANTEAIESYYASL